MFSRATGQQYINVKNLTAFNCLTDELYRLISKALKNGCRSVVFVCIGTDRSTGDSLGPLIGHKIANLKYNHVYVFGNLENPVHAKNLDAIMRRL